MSSALAPARLRHQPRLANASSRQCVVSVRAVVTRASVSVSRPAAIAAAPVVATASARRAASVGVATSAPRRRRPSVLVAAGSDAPRAIKIKVGGMVCDGCSGRVEAALKAAPGVAAASVDLAAGTATVTPAAGGAATAAALVELIKGLGFEASLQ